MGGKVAVNKKTCTTMFIAAKFVVAKNQKHSRCPWGEYSILWWTLLTGYHMAVNINNWIKYISKMKCLEKNKSREIFSVHFWVFKKITIRNTAKGFIPLQWLKTLAYNKQLNIKCSLIPKTTQSKNGQKTWTDISPKNTHMVNRHMRRCSIELIIRKMQIKTTLRYHLTPVRVAII